MKSTISILILSGLFSCASNPNLLSDQARQVIVYTHPSQHNCEVIGRFTGSNDEGLLELARNQAKNSAAKKGANGIIFDDEIKNGPNWTVNAVGLKCP